VYNLIILGFRSPVVTKHMIEVRNNNIGSTPPGNADFFALHVFRLN